MTQPDSHVEHTGHGGHHVFDEKVLLRTFLILVALTVLTVVLALFERGYVAADTFGFEFELPFELPFGRFSIVIALGIAAVKAYFVAANFMGLKYEKGANPIIFGASLMFLVIFFTFTFFDTGFRDTFEKVSAVPTDVLEEEALRAEQASKAIAPAVEAQPLVQDHGAELFGPATADTTSTP